MLKLRPLIIAGIVIAILGLAAGISRLLSLRYQQGDIFPPYSTLRADPLGAKGLFDALSELGGLTVERNYRSLEQHPAQEPVTMIYAGASRTSSWRQAELAHARAMLVNGSRLVFSFTPETWSRRTNFPPLIPAPATPPTPAPVPAGSDSAEAGGTDSETAPASPAEDPSFDEPPAPKFQITPADGVPFAKALEEWGVNFAVRSDPRAREFDLPARATDEAKALGLEPMLSWHSAMYFKNLKPEWRVLYRCDGKPVIIERQMGDGGIVLISDSYFLSNEALRRERRPALLEWVAGPLARIVFDEEHHGVSESINLAGLGRKYGLGGVIACLALLAILYVWKHAVPLVPRRPVGVEAEAEIEGKDAEEGLV
ncbi:MAG: DUF4350 domain-containing protein, partial [Chthoniobacteraceae bacterium]